MTAEGAAKGIPRVSSGIIDPITALLLADSGPTTPSIAPCPNSWGVLESLFSRDQEINVEMTVQGPGNSPTKKPKTEPRNVGPTERLISGRLG